MKCNDHHYFSNNLVFNSFRDIQYFIWYLWCHQHLQGVTQGCDFSVVCLSICVSITFVVLACFNKLHVFLKMLLFTVAYIFVHLIDLQAVQIPAGRACILKCGGSFKCNKPHLCRLYKEIYKGSYEGAWIFWQIYWWICYGWFEKQLWTDNRCSRHGR